MAFEYLSHFQLLCQLIITIEPLFVEVERTDYLYMEVGEVGRLQCLTQISTIVQLYHGGQFYW